MAKILLAESVPSLPEIGHTFLARHGCELHTTQEIEGLIDVIRSERPDLLLLEMGAHFAELLECCRAVKSDTLLQGTRIVCLIPSTLDEKRCLEAGSDDVASTPLTPMRLLELGRRHLGLRERRSERVVAVLRVEFVRDGVFGSGFTRDVSANGMYLTTRARLLPGDRLQSIEFRLKGSPGEPKIETSGVVARVEPANDATGEVHGAGIELTGLGPREHIELVRFVRDHAGATS